MRKKRSSFGIIFFILACGAIALFVWKKYPDMFSSSSTINVKQDTALKKENTTSSLIDLKTFEEQIKNASLTIPETDIHITLVDGRATYSDAYNGGDVAFVSLLGAERISSQVTHVFADIVVNSGGSGTFHYIVLFEVRGKKVSYLSSFFVGDRVRIESAKAVDGVSSGRYTLMVVYFDRMEGEAMSSEPTVKKQLLLFVNNGVLGEVAL
jgi:hypothetical protein